MEPVFAELLRANAAHAGGDGSRFDAVQDGQRPVAATVCCADSRVLADQLWGNDEPGRLFTVTNIGNRVVQRTADGDVVSGDVRYPLVHLGTALVVVVGHTGCGAVTAAYDALTGGRTEPGGIGHCVDLLAAPLEGVVESLPAAIDRPAAVNRLVEHNVDRQVDRLLHSDDGPAAITAVGVVYDFQDVYPGRRGEVHVVNVAGETAVEELRADYPDIADRIRRLTSP